MDVVNINLIPTFRYCREAVQHFMPRDEGVIVNVSSVNGTAGPPEWLEPVSDEEYQKVK